MVVRPSFFLLPFFARVRAPLLFSIWKKPKRGVERPRRQGRLCIPVAMLRRTAAVLFETAGTRAALSSKRASTAAGAPIELHALSLSKKRATTTTTSSSTSSFPFSFAAFSFLRRGLHPPKASEAAAATTSTSTSSPSISSLSGRHRRSYWNDGYQRFGDQQRRGGGRGGGGRRGNQQQDPRSTFLARPRLASLLGGATLAAGGAVYYSSRETVPYTLRNHSILISKELEVSLGESTFAQIVQDARARRRLLPRNHPSVRAVERIGRRLAAVASDSGGGGYSKHMEGLEWEFVVVDDPGNVNAMVAPGEFFLSFFLSFRLFYPHSSLLVFSASLRVLLLSLLFLSSAHLSFSLSLSPLDLSEQMKQKQNSLSLSLSLSPSLSLSSPNPRRQGRRLHGLAPHPAVREGARGRPRARGRAHPGEAHGREADEHAGGVAGAVFFFFFFFFFFWKRRKKSFSLFSFSLTLAQKLSKKIISMILYWAFGIPLPLGALELALFLPNSRAAETEADVIGVRLAARACYDPSAAATVFEKLGEAERRAGGGASIPAFMRTHPLSDKRVKRVRAELPAARLLYEKAGCSLPRSALRQFVNVLTGEEEEVEIGGGGGGGRRRRQGDGEIDDEDGDEPLARLFK